MARICVPDTSVVIDGRVTRLIESGELQDCEVLVPNLVVAELEHQANMGKDSGFSGLTELKKLRALSNAGKVRFSLVGRGPTHEQLAGAEFGTIDAAIRDVAREHGAMLITSDAIMADAGRAEGLEVWFLELLPVGRKPKLLDYFGPGVMSVHLKERVRPMAKVGRPGKFELRILDEKPLTEEQLRELAHEIVELSRQDKDSFVEI